ncbi:MAG: CubicO group peptidase (beta-lactamase class C family) [Saprospiraceae bacterium]|jgi:CubicO group peptidase (beta-lactamase class C family)
MKALKRIILVISSMIILLAITGNNHIYLGLYDTYLQGRTKPAVDDPDLFPSRTIKCGTPQPWEKHTNYHSGAFSEKANKANSDLSTLGFIVIKDDSLVFEKYLNGHCETALSNSFSMAKSLLSVLVGCAIKEGKIKLTDQVNTYLPEYIQEKDSALQVVHLLNMTSGMNFDESYGNPFGFMAQAYYGSDLKSLLLGYELTTEPGTRWEYLGGNNLLLSLLLEKALGKNMSTYAQEKVWQPLGMEQDAKWILDHEQGNEKTFSGLYATSRDFAKIGQLYMKYGNWKGKQVVDISYVQKSTSGVNVIDKHGNNTDNYGYAWWLVEHKDMDVFFMQGILGQYVLCIPEKDIIIVRTGKRRMEKSNGVNPDDLFIWLEEGLRIATQN